MRKRTAFFLSVGKILIPGCFIFLFSCANNENKPAAETKNTGTSEQKEVPGKEACSLLTESDAKAILGNAIQPGMQTASMCQYLSAAEELSKTGESVSLTIHKNAGRDFDKYVMDTETSTAVKTEPVAGVGNKAAWADGSLIVQQADDLLVIIVGKKMEKEKHIAAAKSLAASIISRM